MSSAAQDRTDVVVVGGGLAGLVAAVDASRAGAATTLVEARSAGGGRARSDSTAGFHVNHGAHALYRAGAARAVLDDLGVSWSGHLPRVKGSGLLVDGKRVSPMSRGGMAAAGGVAGLRALARAVRASTVESWRGRSMADWFEAQPAAARPVLWTAIRTSTYQADLDACDAGDILAQLRRGARGVDYLDGGWQTLVDGLERMADADGVRRVHGKVTAVRPEGERWSVEFADGAIDAGAVVIAVGGATEADGLLAGRSSAVRRWAEVADPVVASTLEVLLRSKPVRGRVAAYAVDEPVYSVDAAASCRVAPEGAALVHGLFYEPDRLPEAAPRARLEAALDAWQPGWRDRVVEVIERKRMVVAHDRPRLAPAADRPAAVIPDLDGVFLASDAVTTDGLLADAAASSARVAARAAATRAAKVRRTQTPTLTP